ncbi:MAG: hypothetical protein RB191_24355 [Terriglobia bacterium]|nr:hypothetical protein [Terriglobia bacterium]
MSDDLRAGLMVLQDARARIVPIRKWWTPLRLKLNLCDEDACCAMTAFPDLIDTPGAEFAIETLAGAMGCETFEIPEWNDSHSHAELVQAFGMAIAGLYQQILPQTWRESVMA